MLKPARKSLVNRLRHIDEANKEGFVRKLIPEIILVLILAGLLYLKGYINGKEAGIHIGHCDYMNLIKLKKAHQLDDYIDADECKNKGK